MLDRIAPLSKWRSSLIKNNFQGLVALSSNGLYVLVFSYTSVDSLCAVLLFYKCIVLVLSRVC